MGLSVLLSSLFDWIYYTWSLLQNYEISLSHSLILMGTLPVQYLSGHCDLSLDKNLLGFCCFILLGPWDVF